MTPEIMGDGGPRRGRYDPDLARRINSQKSIKPETPRPAFPQSPAQTELKNPKDYLILPDHSEYGTFSYPDLLVAKRRLADCEEVRQAAQSLGFTNLANEKEHYFGNTALTANGHTYDYAGNINWRQALTLNLILGGFTLNLRQHADFRKLLQEGADGKTKVYDGAGKEVSSQELIAIYNDILEKRNPLRSEWLDAKFIEDRGVWKMIYNHSLDSKGNLIGKIENLKEYIKKHCYADLTFNNQGLATSESSDTEYKQGKNIYFWHPRTGGVARFGVSSDGAYLYCDNDPSDSYGSLGVRIARIFEGAK